AVSALGLARALTRKEKVRHVLSVAQKELFVPAAELAVPPDHYAEYSFRGPVVTGEMVSRLTMLIEELEEEVSVPEEFIIPGETAASAAIDLARTVVRRAERRAAQLFEEGQLPNENILKYLNRMADLLFLLARYEEGKQSGAAEN
ncbi:MAG: ATP:cob(I)alamin adenosyltransferase, partial [Moorella sp. (in: Bacteria)]|nr:ATP:cob(I)alamin adenosyltransferase [Moorella sp. (in: firmicutes)]